MSRNANAQVLDLLGYWINGLASSDNPRDRFCSTVVNLSRVEITSPFKQNWWKNYWCPSLTVVNTARRFPNCRKFQLLTEYYVFSRARHSQVSCSNIVPKNQILTLLVFLEEYSVPGPLIFAQLPWTMLCIILPAWYKNICLLQSWFSCFYNSL